MIDALVKKGKAMCDSLSLKTAIISGDSTKEQDSQHHDVKDENAVNEAAGNLAYKLYSIDEVDQVYSEIQKWSDMSDSKVSMHYQQLI